MVQAQSGDRAAFTELAAAIGDRLYAVAYRILRDADVAEDVAQQTIITVWRELPQLRDPDRFETWAFRVLVRACYREGRRNRRGSVNLYELELSDEAPDPGIAVADRDQLERGFARLAPDQRTAIVLQHYLGYTLPQIAELTDVPLGTVSSRLHAAKRALRAALEADRRPGRTRDVPA